jgi:hypothetical protein
VRSGRGAHSAANVNELADPLTRHPADGAVKELLVLPDGYRERWEDIDKVLREFTVGREVVLAAVE